MKDDKDNVIQVDFVHQDGMDIGEFIEALQGSGPDIILESFACDYEEFLEDDLNISLEAYYENIDEEKLVLEKMIQKDNGVVWHYINNENGLLNIDHFYSIKEKIDDRFNGSRIELDKVLQIEDSIVIIFKGCEFKSNGLSLEDATICTLEELKNFKNEEFMNSLSEERRNYLKNLFEGLD